MSSGPETNLSGQVIDFVKECPSCGYCYDSNEKICRQDGSTLKCHLRNARLLANRYLLERRIGQGGMSAVYQASDLSLNRQVAIKILHMQSDVESLRRFEREAKTSMTLKHPNIITVYDYGQLPGSGSFLVMELFKGQTLREILDQEQTLPSYIAAHWFNQLCEGLKEAHRLSIIHRDLKPDNIFIMQLDTDEDQVKIFDFGLAKARQSELAGTNITAPGTVLGTLGYMPPEQLMGDEVDERGDIFSLSVIIAEALTGERPFDGISVVQLMAATLQDIFNLKGTSPESVRLNEILQRAMAKNRLERYSSVAELQTELIPAIANYLGD